MQSIRDQRDLASLSEPRFIYTAPAWFRRFAASLLVIGALIGAFITLNAVAGGMVGVAGHLTVLVGMIAVAICFSLLMWGRPLDWRVWINLAATPDGLFLVARARRVVFVPWADVLDIAVVHLPSLKGDSRFAKLTLRLPEESWDRFGPTSAIEGTGPVRTYLVSALATPGNELVARIQAFRAEHA